MKNSVSPYRIAAFLFIIFALVSNFIWLKKDYSMCGVDNYNHLCYSLDFFYNASDIIHNSVLSLGQKFAGLMKLFSEIGPQSSIYWPNGLNLTAAIFYSIFGVSLFSAKLSLLPYLFILLLSTYMIGRQLFSESVGLVATIILFMYPIIFQSSRQFQLDFPLTAMVALTTLFLLKCDYFRDRKYSFLLGLSLGCAMLVKGQALIFLACPLILVFYGLFRDPAKRISFPIQLQNMAIFIIIAVSAASIWWGYQFNIALRSFLEHAASPIKTIESGYAMSDKYSLENIFSHFNGLFFAALGPVLFLAFFISFLLFLRKKLNYKGLLIGWIIFPFFLFSLVLSIKHMRFMMPALPAMALITGWGAWQLGKSNKKIVYFLVMAGVSIYVIMQFAIFTLQNNPKARSISIGMMYLFGRCTEEVSLGSEYEVINKYKNSFPGREQMIEAIKTHHPGGKPVTMGVISCTGPGVELALQYLIRLDIPKLKFMGLIQDHHTLNENLYSLDFILFIVPEGMPVKWPSGQIFLKKLKQMNMPIFLWLEKKQEAKRSFRRTLKRLAEAQANFTLVKKIPHVVTAGADLYIYKMINDVDPERKADRVSNN